MNSKTSKRIFIILFAILYISVAFVSTFHAVSFFSLANIFGVAIMLAVTFEIGQAAVLFSILTGTSGKRKIIPWILMCVLTLVQILGNVYSSYKYLITNSTDLLRYFKEPIFVWMDLPDQQCNVILTYIVGAILPIVSLLMTSMVTNYINIEDKPKVEPVEEEKPIEESEPVVEETPIEEIKEEPEPVVEEVKQEEPIEEPEPVEEPKQLKPSHFINLK